MGHNNSNTCYNQPIYLSVLRFDKYGSGVLPQILIPVSGSKAAGHLRTQATFQSGRWELDSVVLEFKGRPQTLTIVDSQEYHD